MRKTAFLLLIILLGLLLTSCGGPETTGTLAPTDSQTTTTLVEQTTTSTIMTETTPESTTVETTASIETTAPTTSVIQPGIVFHMMAEDAVHQIDLDGDVGPESVVYHVVDDYTCVLTVNGQQTSLSGDYFLPGWFVLTDLDRADGKLDIAVQELGPSDDYFVSFFYYQDDTLIKRGTVPGTICDPYHEDMASQVYGFGSISLNGAANLIALARGAVLHTWYYDEPWRIDLDGTLAIIPQNYIAMFSYDPQTGKRLSETPVTLKIDLPLYAEPDASAGAALIAAAGESASLVKTDNVQWIQLRTAAGQLGWFQLGSWGYSVIVGDSEMFGEEVFDGLFFAD